MLSTELVSYLFGGKPHALAEAMAAWITESRRFSAFVDQNRDKIRKKLHTRLDADSLRDLRLELEVALLLLDDRAFALTYEPLSVGRSRGPDFAVAYTTSTVFMVEVTRLRAATRLTATTEPLPEGRLADVVCEKLGQLQPRHANVLVVGHEGIGASGQFLRGEMLRLQQRVERNDERLIQRHSFRGRAEFFRGFQRLSALFCRGTDSAGAPVLAVWLNPQAREPLPDKVRSALQRCLAARSWSSD
jgi:hypothetical protein